jgi:hypothetical protein
MEQLVKSEKHDYLSIKLRQFMRTRSYCKELRQKYSQDVDEALDILCWSRKRLGFGDNKASGKLQVERPLHRQPGQGGSSGQGTIHCKK